MEDPDGICCHMAVELLSAMEASSSLFHSHGIHMAFCRLGSLGSL
jgi:hypothetical protein